MAVMRGSGVYATEIDESFQSFDTVNLNFMVPMMTKKGEVGKLNPVTIANFKEKLGYDLDYNGNYLGLAALLSAVSVVQVFRMNKEATYGNLAVFNDGSTVSLSDIEDLDVMEAAQCLRDSDQYLVITGTNDTAQWELGESVKPGTVKIFIEGTLAFTDNGLGSLIPTVGGDYVGSTGTVNYSTGQINLAMVDGIVATTYDCSVQFIHDADLALIISMKTPGDWENLAVSLSRYYETVESIESATAVSVPLGLKVADMTGAYRVRDVNGDVIATTGAVTGATAESRGVLTVTGTGAGAGITGTVNLDTNTVALTLPSSMVSSGPIVLLHEFVQDNKYFNLEVFSAVTVGGSVSYRKLEGAKVSLSPALGSFVDDVEFSNIKAKKVGSLDANSVARASLLYGTDGSIPSASDINFSGVNPADFNMVCMNGVLGASTVSKFVQSFELYNKMVLFDIPNVTTTVAAKLYANSVFASKVGLAYWVSDFRTVGNKEYCIYPSVQGALAYAKMFKASGYLNYPPAGYQYAGVSAERLLETDAGLYAAELKQAKINYIANRSAGPVIWEHRTRYPFESDLSYASTVVTLFALQSRCKAFADNFPFRFVTPEILIQLRTGLETIMADYLQRGFIWMGDIVVPSFSEVKQKGARFMDIYCNVKFAEDGQEFTFNFHVKGKA